MADFEDDFTGEVSDVSLESHTPSISGTAWSLDYGTATSVTLAYTTNAIHPTNSTNNMYRSDDLSSTDQGLIFRFVDFSASWVDSAVAIHFLDQANFVGARLAGLGASGMRMSECLSNTFNDKTLTQGAANSWWKMESISGTAKFYDGGTGGAASFGSALDAGYSVDSSLTSNTRQGIRGSDNASGDWINYFHAYTIGGAGGNLFVTGAGDGGLAGLGGLAGRSGGLAG